MIQIKDIKDIPAELYCPDGKLIGTIENELQLNDVCIQIKKMKLPTEYSGYKLKTQNCVVDIKSNGRIPNISHLNISLFDTINKQLEELLFN